MPEVLGQNPDGSVQVSNDQGGIFTIPADAARQLGFAVESDVGGPLPEPPDQVQPAPVPGSGLIEFDTPELVDPVATPPGTDPNAPESIPFRDPVTGAQIGPVTVSPAPPPIDPAAEAPGTASPVGAEPATSVQQPAPAGPTGPPTREPGAPVAARGADQAQAATPAIEGGAEPAGPRGDGSDTVGGGRIGGIDVPELDTGRSEANFRARATLDVAEAQARQSQVFAEGLRDVARNQREAAEEFSRAQEAATREAEERLAQFQRDSDEVAREAVIDPNRVFKQLGTAGQVISSIGLFLDGFLGNNEFRKVLNGAIQRDMAAQESEIQAREKGLRRRLQVMDRLDGLAQNDIQAAREAASMRLTAAKSMIEAQAAQFNDDVVRARAREAVGKIAEEQADFENTVRQQAAQNRASARLTSAQISAQRAQAASVRAQARAAEAEAAAQGLPELTNEQADEFRTRFIDGKQTGFMQRDENGEPIVFGGGRTGVLLSSDLSNAQVNKIREQLELTGNLRSKLGELRRVISAEVSPGDAFVPSQKARIKQALNALLLAQGSLAKLTDKDIDLKLAEILGADPTKLSSLEITRGDFLKALDNYEANLGSKAQQFAKTRLPSGIVRTPEGRAVRGARGTPRFLPPPTYVDPGDAEFGQATAIEPEERAARAKAAKEPATLGPLVTAGLRDMKFGEDDPNTGRADASRGFDTVLNAARNPAFERLGKGTRDLVTDELVNKAIDDPRFLGKLVLVPDNIDKPTDISSLFEVKPSDLGRFARPADELENFHPAGPGLLVAPNGDEWMLLGDGAAVPVDKLTRKK